MPHISLIPIFYQDIQSLESLCKEIEKEYGIPTQLRRDIHIDPDFAFNAARDQYNSTLFLSKLLELPSKPGEKTIGITELDLYIPVLTFVFGEAQLDGTVSIVSTYRLKNEFYGLPKNMSLYHQRIIKEAIHELGHTFGLVHCMDFECVLRSSTYVEDIDLKSHKFCPDCKKKLLERMNRV